MTAAAGVLNLTQAAVSQQIKRLEESFGCQLFERQRKGLQLTVGGRAPVRPREAPAGPQRRDLGRDDDAALRRRGPPRHPERPRHTYLPTFLKASAQTYPKVRISLVCRTTPRLLEKLQAGEIDLTLTTEIGCGPDGESLFSERLLWVGARGGDAFRSGRCRSRSAATAAPSSRRCSRPCGMSDIPWRMVSDVTNMDAQTATAEADLAVMALARLDGAAAISRCSGRNRGCRSLPIFSINLYLPKAGGTDIAARVRPPYPRRRSSSASASPPDGHAVPISISNAALRWRGQRSGAPRTRRRPARSSPPAQALRDEPRPHRAGEAPPLHRADGDARVVHEAARLDLDERDRLAAPRR